MTWFRSDDEFWRHVKVRKLGRTRVRAQAKVAATGVWHLAGVWSADQLMDGFCPYDQLEQWDPDGSLTARLLQVGLFDEATVAGEDGVLVHDYLTRNRARADVLAERAANAIKAEVYRDKDLVAAVRSRDGTRCRYCGRLVSWKDRRSPAAASFDLVDPALPVGLENVIVACRSCTSSKGELSAAAAGMALLEPGSMGHHAVSGSAPGSTRDASGSDLDTGQVGSGPDQVPVPTRPDPGPPPTSGDPGEGGTRAGPAPAGPAVPGSGRARALELIEERFGSSRRSHRRTGDRPIMTTVGSGAAAELADARAEQDRLAELGAVQAGPDVAGGLSPPGLPQPGPPVDQAEQENAS